MVGARGQERREVRNSQIRRPRHTSRPVMTATKTAVTADVRSTIAKTEPRRMSVAATGTIWGVLAEVSDCSGPPTGATPPPVGWASGPGWLPPPLFVCLVGDGVGLGVGLLGHRAPLG